MENTPSTPGQNSPADSIAGYHDEIAHIHQEGMELGVKKARNALFWTGGLILFWEVLNFVRAGVTPDPIYMVILGVVVGAFIALGFWTKKRPYTAIVLGIILFFAYWLAVVLLFYFFDGSATNIFKALISGIIVKIIIIVTLFRALPDAKELQQIKSGQ